MKVFEITFSIKSPCDERGTLLDIDGILQDAIRDSKEGDYGSGMGEYQVSPIRIEEVY